MNLRRTAKMLLPRIVIDTIRSIRIDKSLRQYLRNHRPPWSEGYTIYREKFLIEALKDSKLMERFRNNEPLPPGYGIGIDERCIEYPWLLAHMEDVHQNLLDAGSTLNYNFVLEHPVFRSKILHILTLAPEGNCFWQKGISYLFHDLRNIPIRDAYYDSICCISTLEHIGCDNTPLTGNHLYHEHHPEDFVLAMRELRRVLKPRGSLFLTVPFGIYCYMGVQQQFDRNLLDRAVEAFGKAETVTGRFFRYTLDGWNVADAADCAECQYVDWSVLVWAQQQRPKVLPIESDLAAAARAVACVRFIKAGQ